MGNLPFDLREQAGSRDKWKVVSVLFPGIDAGKSAAQVQLMDRMKVKADFPSTEMGKAAYEGIDRKAIVGEIAVSGSKNVVVYPADKQRGCKSFPFHFHDPLSQF